MPKKRQTTLLSMFSGGSAMAITPDSSKKKKIRKRNESAANDRAKRKRRDHLLRRLRQNTDSLSKDQKRVLTIVGSGHNAFFTGSAGTGKSHLLRHLLKVMDSSTTFVTAPTGIAACNVGGITIHSFAGIGMGNEDVSKLIDKVKKNRRHRKRWEECKILFIDEVSMLSASLLDKLDSIARKIRQSDDPFGGIQLVLCGDFHQLPPVHKRNSGDRSGSLFCFQAQCWPHLIKPRHCVVLNKVFRQKESKFVRVLNEIRTCVNGNLLSEETKTVLRRLCVGNHQTRKKKKRDTIIPTRLHSLNSNVDSVNARHLRELEGESEVYVAEDSGKMKYLLKKCNALERLELKIGCQVVLLKNLAVNKGLVNGARGVVIKFKSSETDDGDKRMFPVVRFEQSMGGADDEDTSTTDRLITTEEWSLESGGRVVASRSQIPLKLAWALSIHKSQGMTISSLEVCLNKIFEPGQAYVALSRARSLNGIRIVGSLDLGNIRSSRVVLDFYKQMKQMRESLYSDTPPSSSSMIDNASLCEDVTVIDDDDDNDGWMLKNKKNKSNDDGVSQWIKARKRKREHRDHKEKQEGLIQSRKPGSLLVRHVKKNTKKVKALNRFELNEISTNNSINDLTKTTTASSTTSAKVNDILNGVTADDLAWTSEDDF